MDTGLDLFESKGYAATTIDDIAARAGTTRTTFYLHFASKAQLMGDVVKTVDSILTSVDDPALSTVVELGTRDLIRAWISRKFDQWEATRPYLHAVYQAAPVEPEVAKVMEDWFRDVAADMTSGLDRSGRFDPASRQVRCVLAFGQLEYLSQRWIRTGWIMDREMCLETLTDSWCHLLSEG